MLNNSMLQCYGAANKELIISLQFLEPKSIQQSLDPYSKYPAFLLTL